MADIKTSKMLRQAGAKKQKSAYHDAPTVIEDVPGVVVVRHPYGRVDCYSGTAEALVAAGLARPDMFPGQRGRGVGSATYRPSGVQPAEGSYWWSTPGYMRILRKVTGDFTIELVVSYEEQAKRTLARQARDDEREREMETYKKAYSMAYSKKEAQPDPDKADLARRSLASMFESADDYRIYLAENARRAIRITFQSEAKPTSWHGYTLDDESIEDIQASVDAVIEAIVRANVRFDAALHAEIAQGYRAEIAAADASFQTQLASFTRPNPALLEGGVR